MHPRRHQQLRNSPHAPDGPRGGPFSGLDAGFGFGGRGRGRGRARRGDIRTAVLALLGERPMHGYEIIQELAARTDGAWRPSAGSVYPTLQLLEDEGAIAGEDVEGKRRFALTDAGRAELAGREGPAPWERFTVDLGAEAVGMRDALHKFVGAWKQLVTAGNDDQQRRAVEVVNDARRRLYAILAED